MTRGKQYQTGTKPAFGVKLEFFDLPWTYAAPHVAFFQMHTFFIASLRIRTLEKLNLPAVVPTSHMSTSLGTP
ncbi:hypothetical protein VN97_g4596 [Penicillium thymicola]|uniref:Uncharacterized protein n=1 Tax=Penicillium thymicola TaxID=293382 RepID=A0AAI9TK99_PENTH|nr:hypothetical protein VN97_g4596 [Penicillium thymicola]